ncbi:olfactory receptor 5AR1-like [Phyllobates terribilis]|uniref:olfactory receptor 5AR1-like n=1 Tax=Phyllobates terribilis TaxID=111132 RepID=UPI003CCB7217
MSIFLFIFFSLVYFITVVGNAGLFIAVHKMPALHTPMYYFLSYLSVVDLFYSSSVTPKMIADLSSIRKVLTFYGCAIQFFFFATFAVTEILTLSNMSYDSYVAICHPLHYMSIMNKQKCMLLGLFALSFGILPSFVQTCCMFSLRYCGLNLIDHFYCDVPPVLKLSCSKTFTCEMITLLIVGSYSIGTLATILVSYIYILMAILHITSSKGRQKAFSTCYAHIFASIFSVSVFLTYLRPPSENFEKQDKVASVFYSVITPMLNPLIYSLRNQDVKTVIVNALVRALHSLRDIKIRHFRDSRAVIFRPKKLSNKRTFSAESCINRILFCRQMIRGKDVEKWVSKIISPIVQFFPPFGLFFLSSQHPLLALGDASHGAIGPLGMEITGTERRCTKRMLHGKNNSSDGMENQTGSRENRRYNEVHYICIKVFRCKSNFSTQFK